MGAKDSLMGRLLGSADKFTDKQVAETLAMLVKHGVERAASDIHIEPHERFVLVRYRIDGALRGIHKLPRLTLGSMLAELKAKAGLNTQETHMPQEGDYTFETPGKKIEVHVATMPVYGGEKAVLHLTEERGSPLDLASLGFWGIGLATLKSVLANPHGLILVAGPKHNGLSSTLFSLLRDVSSPLVSVATVETTTKHRLPGVNQTYLNGAMTMQEGLRATLKQDPNIIMLDNLSDGVSADLAVQAATTGHLVLAGLHAEGAVAAVLRMRHGGVEPFVLASGLRASVGQRLVRRLCPDCRERYALSPEDLKQVEESFGITTSTARKRLHELEKSALVALGDSKQLSSAPTHIGHLWRASEHGCNSCNHSGYQGRVAIYEVLKNSDELHKALLAKEPMSAAAIQSAMLKEGFTPMALDGLVKALRGVTTPSEVLRALTSQPTQL